MRTARRACIGALLALLAVAASPAWASATSCSGPQLVVDSPSVAPGTTLWLSGVGFGTRCEPDGLGAPAKDVEIVVRVGSREKVVGRVSVGPDYDFVISVHVPPSLGTGSGSIAARLGGTSMPDPEVPIEVVGSPGDVGDRPPFDIDGARSSTGVPWAWVALGAVVGALAALGLVTVVGRDVGGVPGVGLAPTRPSRDRGV